MLYLPLQARTNPAFASMIIAWSFSEIIRYSFYTFNLLGLQPPQWLVWIRYSAFYVLYPIGAGSEWFLTWISLPNSSPVPGFRSWYQGAWGFMDYLRGIMVLVWAPGTRSFASATYASDPMYSVICSFHLYDGPAPQGAWRRS